MYARSFGESPGAGSAASGCALVSDHGWTTALGAAGASPSAVSTNSAIVSSPGAASHPFRSCGARIKQRIPQSFAMRRRRVAGEPGSSGTYTAPARSAPSIAATARPDRGRCTPTRSPFATPAATSACAKRFAIASSSA
jgi:hypothetical protein